MYLHTLHTGPSKNEHFNLFREPDDKGAQLWQGSKCVDHWEAEDDDCRRKGNRHTVTCVCVRVCACVRACVTHHNMTSLDMLTQHGIPG